MSSGRATAIGFGAVLLWALLALFTVNATGVPPFQLSAMCFAVGGTLGIAWIALSTSNTCFIVLCTQLCMRAMINAPGTPFPATSPNEKQIRPPGSWNTSK